MHFSLLKWAGLGIKVHGMESNRNENKSTDAMHDWHSHVLVAFSY